jgi:hypothetical protein
MGKLFASILGFPSQANQNHHSQSSLKHLRVLAARHATVHPQGAACMFLNLAEL